MAGRWRDDGAGRWQDDGRTMAGRWQDDGSKLNNPEWSKNVCPISENVPGLMKSTNWVVKEFPSARSEVFGARNLVKGPSKILNGDG